MIPLSSSKIENHAEIRKINQINQLIVPNWCLELNNRDILMLEDMNGPVLVVPEQMKQPIMEACHESITEVSRLDIWGPQKWSHN